MSSTKPAEEITTSKSIIRFQIVGHPGAFAVIFLASITLNLVLITNPGYFSHDELQRWDDVEKYGILGYLQLFMRVPSVESLSHPFRPFGFAILGLLSFVQNDFPPLVHLVGALTTGLVGFVFYLFLLEAGMRFASALRSALIFMVLPTTVLATGWAAALMDQWYVTFGIAGLLMSLRYLRTGRLRNSVVSSLFFGMALLSKETAVVWPVVLVMVVLFVGRHKAVTRPQWITLLVAWSLPAFAYLVARNEAFLGTLVSPVSGHYGLNLENVPRNVFAYFVFPFVPSGGWVSSVQLAPALLLLAALVAHLGLAFWLIRLSPKVGWLYLPAYFVLLSPVIALNATGAQYLFGPGLALAGALGFLTEKFKANSIRALVSWALVGLLASISGLAQVQIHKAGVCSRVALTSVEAVHASMGFPDKIDLVVEEGTYAHVVKAAFFARERVGRISPVQITLVQKGSKSGQRLAEPYIEIDSSCRARIHTESS